MLNDLDLTFYASICSKCMFEVASHHVFIMLCYCRNLPQLKLVSFLIMLPWMRWRTGCCGDTCMHLRDLDDEGTDQPVMFRFMGRTLSESIIRFSLLFYWKFYLVHFNPGQTISPVTNPNRKSICPKIKKHHPQR